jgi:hypothetical protein
MIYCTGMSRTGTTTFSDFLKRYQKNVIHYPTLDQLMMGVGDGASDIPVIPYYKELHKMRPDSKFVHLTRENWVDSVEPYFLRKKERTYGSYTMNLRTDVYGAPQWDRKKYHDAYKRHNDDVREYFKDSKNFLEMSITSGDTPDILVDFLGLPQKGYQFGKSNARENTWKK